jgi:hypothetical protein
VQKLSAVCSVQYAVVNVCVISVLDGSSVVEQNELSKKIIVFRFVGAC